jgi:hypothetical protein
MVEKDIFLFHFAAQSVSLVSFHCMIYEAYMQLLKPMEARLANAQAK